MWTYQAQITSMPDILPILSPNPIQTALPYLQLWYKLKPSSAAYSNTTVVVDSDSSATLQKYLIEE